MKNIKGKILRTTPCLLLLLSIWQPLIRFDVFKSGERVVNIFSDNLNLKDLISLSGYLFLGLIFIYLLAVFLTKKREIFYFIESLFILNFLFLAILLNDMHTHFYMGIKLEIGFYLITISIIALVAQEFFQKK